MMRDFAVHPAWRANSLVISGKVATNQKYNLALENLVSTKFGFEVPTYRIWDGIADGNTCALKCALAGVGFSLRYTLLP